MSCNADGGKRGCGRARVNPCSVFNTECIHDNKI